MTHEMGSTTLWLMLLLGAYHGINPGMGWLFAVALGMQQQKGSAVAKALVPIALGHALSIGIVVVAAAFLGMALPQEAIRYSIAALLFGLGISSLVRHYHPTWVRMQVGFRDLTVWSFLMATAHGAGLMLLPVLLGTCRGLRNTSDPRRRSAIGTSGKITSIRSAASSGSRTRAPITSKAG